ncbi:MAG: hypothetical protein ACK4PR_05760, partial [Gammaproteobacteria bacterium]
HVAIYHSSDQINFAEDTAGDGNGLRKQSMHFEWLLNHYQVSWSYDFPPSKGFTSSDSEFMIKNGN